MDDPAIEEENMIELHRRRDYRRALSIAITTVVLLVFLYVVYRQWHGGKLDQLKFPVLPFLLSATGMFGLSILLGLFWCLLVRMITGAHLSMAALLHSHFVTWLARYIPGKITQLAGKVIMGENAGYPRGPLIASVYYENALFIGSGISTFLLCLGPSVLKRYLAPALSETWLVLLAILMISILLLSVNALPLVMRRFLKGSGWAGHVIPFRSAVKLFVTYHLTHMAAGAGFYFLLAVITPESSISFFAAIGILTAAHIGGILAFIVPAGLGVRDTILAMLLSGYMPVEQAVLISLITRVWSILADVYVLVTIPVLRLVWKRTAP